MFADRSYFRRLISKPWYFVLLGPKVLFWIKTVSKPYISFFYFIVLFDIGSSSTCFGTTMQFEFHFRRRVTHDLRHDFCIMWVSRLLILSMAGGFRKIAKKRGGIEYLTRNFDIYLIDKIEKAIDRSHSLLYNTYFSHDVSDHRAGVTLPRRMRMFFFVFIIFFSIFFYRYVLFLSLAFYFPFSWAQTPYYFDSTLLVWSIIRREFFNLYFGIWKRLVSSVPVCILELILKACQAMVLACIENQH